MRRPKSLRDRLRGLLHGPVLGTIAATVAVPDDDGVLVHHPVETWKEWFRSRLLGPEVSTEDDLSDSQLHRFILAIEATAATRMGVTFTNRSRQP